MKTAIIHIRDGDIINKPFKEFEDGYYESRMKNLKKRTLPQNSWFHGVLPDILQGLQDIGYTEVKTTEHAKAVVKALFFKKVVTNGIDEIEIIEGTSDSSKIDFAARATEIIDWAASYLGIKIAPPSSQAGLWDCSYEAEYDSQTDTIIIKK